MVVSFLTKLIGFCLSVLGISSLIFVLPLSYGELSSPRSIAELQATQATILYGAVSEYHTFEYKLAAVQLRQPEIIAIGSSRMFGFSAPMFNLQPDKFYNSSGGGWGLFDIQDFFHLLNQNDKPEVIILGLDQDWFNQNMRDNPSRNNQYNPFNVEQIIDATTETYQILADHAVPVDKILSLMAGREPIHANRAIGLNAILFGEGYLNDGSRQRGTLILNPELAVQASQEHYLFAENSDRRFQRGSEVDQEILFTVERFLESAQAQGIYVIGVAVPFTTEIYNIIINDGQHTYLPKAHDELMTLFAQFDFHYFDFSDPTWIGGASSEMADGWHPGELLTLRMYAEMVRTLPDVLGEYSDLAYLENMIANSTNPFQVFDLSSP